MTMISMIGIVLSLGLQSHDGNHDVGDAIRNDDRMASDSWLQDIYHINSIVPGAHYVRQSVVQEIFDCNQLLVEAYGTDLAMEYVFANNPLQGNGIHIIRSVYLTERNGYTGHMTINGGPMPAIYCSNFGEGLELVILDAEGRPSELPPLSH